MARVPPYFGTQVTRQETTQPPKWPNSARDLNDVSENFDSVSISSMSARPCFSIWTGAVPLVGHTPLDKAFAGPRFMFSQINNT
jgi:hypothetical protein